MLKQRTILTTLFLFFLFSPSALAVNLGYMGTSTVGSCVPTGGNTLWADSTYHDDYFETIQFGGNGTATLKMLDTDGNLISEESFTFDSTGWNTTKTFTGSDVKGLQLCLDSGEEVFFMYATMSNTTTPTATFDYTEPTFEEDPVDPPPDDGGTTDPCEGYAGTINPDCPNYEGGTTTDPPPDDGGTTDPPPTEPCPECAVFECPNWSDYMGKVDEIITKLNWEVMSDTWYQIVVPRMVDDFETMLGSAPDPQPTPTQPEPIQSNGFESIRPDITENPELSESGFTLTDLEDEAPVIEFREDPTGGFDIADPVNALPDLPTDDLPIPGQTNAGEWESNKPIEQDNPFPIPEWQEETPDTSTAPIPEETENLPPEPDNGGDAPIPDGTPIEGGTNYKTHPDNPDGV